MGMSISLTLRSLTGDFLPIPRTVHKRADSFRGGQVEEAGPPVCNSGSAGLAEGPDIRLRCQHSCQQSWCPEYSDQGDQASTQCSRPEPYTSNKPIHVTESETS